MSANRTMHLIIPLCRKLLIFERANYLYDSLAFLPQMQTIELYSLKKNVSHYTKNVFKGKKLEVGHLIRRYIAIFQGVTIFPAQVLYSHKQNAKVHCDLVKVREVIH